jgi:hypothetical protein
MINFILCNFIIKMLDEETKNTILINYMENSSNNDAYIYDDLHTTIDDFVSSNSIAENITIINDCVGDIYEAIKLYEDEYGMPCLNDKIRFYAQLAYKCLHDVIFPLIEANRHHSDSDSDNNNDTDLSEADTIEDTN